MYKGLDLSKATQYDLWKIYPDFAPLCITPDRKCNDEELRVLQLKVFARKYQITKLQTTLKEMYAEVYPYFF